MAPHSPAPLQRGTSLRATRVVIVDDSAVVRGFLSRWIEDADDLALAGIASDGVEGIAVVTATQPDVVVLDIEMPKLDGLQALPQILRAAPGCRVLISSRLTEPGARTCLQCLAQGAADVIAKPAFQKNLTALTAFRQDLIGKVRGLSPHRLMPGKQAPAAAVSCKFQSPGFQPGPAPGRGELSQSLTRSRTPQAVLMGASTGGPPAIGDFLSAAAPILKLAPIVIAQHMPDIFTAVFADHLVRVTGFPAKEAAHGEILKPGMIYVAPGGHHTSFAGRGEQARVVISGDPPIRYSRPSIDLMMESGASAFGARAWCVLLTGMGEDGLIGARAVAAAGGQVYAQDETSSVVWGIPGAVVRAGLAHVTDTPKGLAAVMRSMIMGARL